MSRPILAPHEKRTESLPPIRLKLSELLYVQEQSATAGMTVTDYIRTLALTEEVKPRKTKLEASFLVELNRIGVNLNQVSRYLNAGRFMPSMVDNVLLDLKKIMQKLDAVL